MFKHLQHLLDHSGAYANRIHTRHERFWGTPGAENIRNTIMDAENSIDDWKNVRDWQRRLSNKYNAREFAAKHGCKVAALYWVGRDVEDIDFKSLPKNFVIRPSIGHSSNLVFLMKDGLNLFDNKRYQPAEIIYILKKQVLLNKHLRFLVEEFLVNEDGETEILKDYKLFCFNGEIACILVIDRTGPNSGTAGFYDSNWKVMKPVIKKYPVGIYQDPPACFNEMLAQAKKLSKAYEIYVRIDFYASESGAVFGEFTPTPGMGGGVTRFGRKLLLSHWDRHCKGLI